MQEIIQSLLVNLFTTLIIFLLLFTLIGFLFVRKRVLNVYLGLFKILGSVLSTPFVYFRKGLERLADVNIPSSVEPADTRQYLLNKFLTFIEAILVVAAALILAGGLIRGYNAFLPPKDVRDTAEEINRQIDKIGNQLQPVQEQLSTLDQQWASQRDQWMQQARGSLERQLASATSDYTSLENQLSGDPQANRYLENIKGALKSNENYGASYAKSVAQNYIASQYLNANQKDILNSYVNDWYTISFTQHQLAELTEEAIRGKVQSGYASLHNNVQDLLNQLQYEQKNLHDLQPQLKYNFAAFILLVLSSVAVFIVFVWVTGLLVELLWLSVDIAANISTLRQNMMKK
jgi:hypothetical protein